MNTTEQWYEQRVLEPQRQAGEILAYGFEVITLTLAHNTPGGKNSATYTPDFLVVYPGHFEFHEVKARNKRWTSMRDDALVKLKMAAELFPWFGFKLIEIENGQVYEQEL